MLVIITEANTKNSIAIQRELSKNKSLLLIGVSNDKINIAQIFKYCTHYFNGNLGDAVKYFKPDYTYWKSFCKNLFSVLS